MTKEQYIQRLEDMSDLSDDSLATDLKDTQDKLEKERNKYEISADLPQFLKFKLQANIAALEEGQFLIQSLISYRESKK